MDGEGQLEVFLLEQVQEMDKEIALLQAFTYQ